MTISAVILTKNEELKVKEAIKSVSWCEEVLIVDTGSTDSTVSEAKKLGATVVTDKNIMNYSAWRNRGLKEAHGDWILYIDSDEKVTSELKEEIMDKILTESPDTVAYAIPRRNIIFGKEFKWSGQKPDYQKRLFRKSSLQRWVGKLHEEPVIKGRLKHLENPLLHTKHTKLSEMVDKTNEWSDIEAKLLFDSNHPPMNIARFFSALAREFWLRMVLQLAFLDGSLGVIYAIYQVFSKGVTYSKLWELQLKNNIV